MKLRLALCSLLLTSISAWSQNTGEVNRPTFSVGDTWTYQRVDLWKNEVQPGKSTISVKKIKADQIQFRGTFLEGKKWSFNTDLDGNVHYTFKGDKYTNLQFSWPLNAGKSWKNDRQFASGEADVTLEEICEVGTLEKVTVPAGEFDTYKIACKSFFTNSLGGQGSVEAILWYAPTVKRYVKYQYRDWVGSRLAYQYKDELTEFHVTDQK